ncbi:aldehyde reductase [Favolaschia claudopus]|uniref:Aldehyde reductase n=1 Tax=Favolaschia claudopus TaxID=2862362 RepID=A0AAW0AK94_9AGAR
MSSLPVKAIFGGQSIGVGKAFPDAQSIERVYQLLEEGGCDTIDTSRLYGDSEEWLGKTGAPKRFTIHSNKTPGGRFVPGTSTSETIPLHAKETFERLGRNPVDIYYMHAPDPGVPLEDTLKGIHLAHKAGYFHRFGLSNYTAPDIDLVYTICQQNGYPLPSAYQGNYSAVARKLESAVLPTLRRLHIPLYVYSPMAGGLLTKTPAQLRAGGADAGRFAQGHMLQFMYAPLYDKPVYYEALGMWEEVAREVGCSRAESAYRWVAFDSMVDAEEGDAIVFGASRHEHIEETLKWLKRGSVGEKAKAKLEEIWKLVENEAPLDNYNQ